MSLKIFINFDDESGEYELMCADGRSSPMPCGPRIFRAEPHPQVKFRHETKAGAALDADLIRHYLANLPAEPKGKK